MDTEPVRSQPTHIVHLSLDSGEVKSLTRTKPSRNEREDLSYEFRARWDIAYRITISEAALRKYRAMIRSSNL
jgi:hypothetical protein